MKTVLTIAAITVSLLVQASGNFSLIEVNPMQGVQTFFWDDSAGAGQLSGFTELNGRLYFSAQDSYDNAELWSTDGTQSGTWLVKEINSNGSANIGNIVKTGNRIYFMASDSLYGDYDLFTSDGTATGTLKVVELNAYWNGGLDGGNSTEFNNQFIFNSVGALAGLNVVTGNLQTLKSTTQYNHSFGFSELNGRVYFIMTNDSSEHELWKTDGTIAGTQFIKNLFAASQIRHVEQMVAFNGSLYLVASVSGYATDLFSMDVTGQIQQFVIAPGSNAFPRQITIYNNALYFSATNGTTANVYGITTTHAMPKELVQNSSFSVVEHLSFAGNRVYFLGDDLRYIHSIHLNTLVYQATDLKNYSMPYYWMADGPMLVGIGGKIFFAAYDTSTGKQVFIQGDDDVQSLQVIMPSGATTEHPFNVWLSCGMSDVFDFKVWGSKVIVPANFNNAGRELWIFETKGLENNLSEIVRGNELMLFPNPASDKLTVKTNNNAYCDQHQQLFIANSTGELVFQTTLLEETTSIELAPFTAGNYFAILSENGKVITTKKFVLAK